MLLLLQTSFIQIVHANIIIYLNDKHMSGDGLNITASM